MGLDLTPYQRQRSQVQTDLQRELASGSAFPTAAAVLRQTMAIMDDELSRPGVIAQFGSRPQGIMTAAEAWRLNCQTRASARFDRSTIEPARVLAKIAEYRLLGDRIRQLTLPDYLFQDQKNGLAYFVQDNDLVRRALANIVAVLQKWVAMHISDDDFFTRSAREGLLALLTERQDLVAALRLAQNIGADILVTSIPINRPLYVEAVEIGVSLVPILGSAVALYEVYTGRDLFGYKLDPITRAIMAVCVLLPLAGRFVRYGRALYTATRLEALYGADAARWSMSLAVGERLSGDVRAIQTLRRAETAIRTGTALDRALLQEVDSTLSRLSLRNASSPAASGLSHLVEDSLKKLISARQALTGLDELALSRIVAKGPSIDAMKGQLLEELLENRIMAWLRDAASFEALGLTRPPEGAIFIPGSLIRDLNSRQLTDGILAVRRGDTLEVLAVFEAKAGARASRELAHGSGGFSSLTQGERDELMAYARDIFLDEQEQARLAGQPEIIRGDLRAARLQEIIREVALNEYGGQVRRDVERMASNPGGALTTVQVAGERLKILMSPTRTKFFGIVPKDVSASSLATQLKDLHYNFEVIGMNVTQAELISIARELLPIATPP